MYLQKFLTLVETLSEVEDHESCQVIVDCTGLGDVHLRHKDVLTHREREEMTIQIFRAGIYLYGFHLNILSWSYNYCRYLDVGFEQITSASLHHFVHHLHKSSRGRGPEIT